MADEAKAVVTNTYRLELVFKFDDGTEDGKLQQLSLNDPRATPEEQLEPSDIEALNAFMVANQPIISYNLYGDELPFEEISSAAVVITTKNMFYESEEGNFAADQAKLAARNEYYQNNA